MSPRLTWTDRHSPRGHLRPSASRAAGSAAFQLMQAAMSASFSFRSGSLAMNWSRGVGKS